VRQKIAEIAGVEDVILYALEAQLGRLNLTEIQRATIAYKAHFLKESIEAKKQQLNTLKQ